MVLPDARCVQKCGRDVGRRMYSSRESITISAYLGCEVASTAMHISAAGSNAVDLAQFGAGGNILL